MRDYNDIVEESKSFQDDNDCTVVAVSLVTGIPYAEAHALMAAAGRKRNKGSNYGIYHPVIINLGFTIDEIFLTSKTVRTVERELAQHHGGQKILISVRGHVLVWNGKQIADWSAGRTKRIQKAFLVYEIGKRPTPHRVPVPEQRKMRVTARPRSAVTITIPSMNVHDEPHRSVKAAYLAHHLNLKGHQLVRRHVKHFGQVTFTAITGYYDYHEVTLKLVK